MARSSRAPETTVVMLGDDWALRLDGRRGWTLLKRKVRAARVEDGKLYDDWQPIGHYADIGAAARRLLMEGLTGQGYVDLATLAQELKYALHRVTRQIAEASGWPAREA